MDIVDRFLKVRLSTGLSQTEFGERVGVGRGAIRNIEGRLVAPKDAFLKLVCKEFHIDPDWLFNGEGEMQLGDSEILFEELAKDYDLDELDKKIVRVYLELDHDKRMVLKEFLKKIVE